MRRILARATILVLAVFLCFAALMLPGRETACAADGTCGEACVEPSTSWYFAEGYTGEGFQDT